MPFSVLEKNAPARPAAKSSGFRVLQPQGTTPPLAAFLVGAGREVTSPIRAVKGLFGVEPSERDVEREALATQLAQEHPIATGVGTAVGFIPSLVAGSIATKPLAALPFVSRLASGGRLARVAAEAVKQGAAFGAAEAFQGRPQEIPRAFALGAAFAPAGAIGGRGFRVLATRAAVGAGSVGLTSAALAPPSQRLQQGAFGAGIGAFGGALTRPLGRPPLSQPLRGLPGAAPESVLIPSERVSVQEAAQAAKEGFETFKRPFVRMTERQELELFQTQYPGLFPKGKKGFVFIPEETPQLAVKGTRAFAQSALETRLRSSAERVASRIDGFQSRLGLSERAGIVAPETEAIATTGTLGQEARVPLREAGTKPETRTFQFSEAQIRANQVELITLKREMDALTRTLSSVGDQAAVHGGREAERALTEAQVLFNRQVEQFRTLRFAAGRAVKTFDIPPDLAAALREAGVLTSGLRTAKARLPIYTNILKSLRNINRLTQSEQQAFGRDLVDAWRLNLFAVTSWTLDLGGNLTETALQVGGAAGRDVGHVLGGRLTFPSLQGFFRALKRKPLPALAAEGIEQQVAGGELMRLGGFRKGPGTFTTRTTPASQALDYLVGSPLYAKGVVDGGFRKYVASAHLWRKAIEAADRQGLRGLSRRAFYDRFWTNTPQEAIDAVVREGNKAGFARTLSKTEERIAGSTAMRLFGDAFARWPFQFTRALGEWLGVNPEMWRRLATGRQVADLGEYAGKTLTGWGGVWAVNEIFYNNVDWRSMEYVTPDGNRVRLAGRDPIPSILFVLATLKRDKDAAVSALRFASLPFAKVLVGLPEGRLEGGLLGSLVSNIGRAVQQRQVLPRALHRELTDTVNRLIPGQSILSALKTVFDPITREGIGANLPGVSLALPSAINPTTGDPLQPTQRILGSPEFPQIGSTPIPGAERQLDPVARLLSTLGLLTYRGPHSPIAGVPASQIDESLRREWTIALGRERQQLLLPVARELGMPMMRRRLETNPAFREQQRKRVQGLDAIAAKRATNTVQQRAGGFRKLPRQPTARERQLPRRFVR